MKRIVIDKSIAGNNQRNVNLYEDAPAPQAEPTLEEHLDAPGLLDVECLYCGDPVRIHSAEEVKICNVMLSGAAPAETAGTFCKCHALLKEDCRETAGEMTPEQFHKQWDVTQINALGKWYWYNFAAAYAKQRVEQAERRIVTLGQRLMDSTDQIHLAKLKANELEAKLEKMREALRKRQRKGHNDTCSYMLSTEYDCDCGFDEAAALLAE